MNPVEWLLYHNEVKDFPINSWGGNNTFFNFVQYYMDRVLEIEIKNQKDKIWFKNNKLMAWAAGKK